MEDRDKTKEQLVRELVSLRRRVADLEATQADRQASPGRHLPHYEEELEGREPGPLRAETAVWKLAHDLGERVKELDCLYGISALVEEPGISLSEILSGTVHLIPPAWQYPDVTVSRILLEDQAYETSHFQETRWKQSSDIYAHGEPAGSIEVRYLEERPESHEGPFLEEERSLLNAIAARLGRIVERKRAEEALWKSEQRYRHLVGSLQEGVWEIDRDAQTTFVNSSMTEMLGYSAGEMQGRHLFEFMDERGIEIAKHKLERRQEGVREQHDFEFLHRDGTRVYTTLVTAPLTDEDGAYAGAIAGVMDMTEHRRAERALVESESRLRMLTESTPTYIYELDAGGIIRYANRTYEKITSERVVGSYLVDWFPEEQRPNIIELLEQVVASGEGQSTEYTIPNLEGEMRSYLAEVRPVVLEGRVTGAILTANDVTALKRVEGALQQALGDLDRRVQERTVDLARTNELLRMEIALRSDVEQALERRIDELSVLNRLGQQVGASLSLGEVATASLEGVAGSVAPDLAMLYLRRGDALTLLATHPKDPPLSGTFPTVKKVGRCLCGLAADKGEPSYARDIHADSRCTLEECKQAGMRSFAALPLRKGPDVLGVLGLASKAMRDFAQEADFLEALSAEISIGVQNSLLHEELNARAAELEREVAEHQRTGRVLHTLSECNRVMSQAESEPELLRDICQIVVTIGGYRLAWVGFAEQTIGEAVRPVAQAGFEEGYLETVDVTWSDSDRGRGPTGTAIRTGKPVASSNMLTDSAYAPWREEAIRRGYASSIALPLSTDGQPLGSLNIYAAEPDAFDAQEIDLLVELADNLAFGIVALRTHAERREAEEALRRYAERLEALHQVDLSILEVQSPEAIAQATLSRLGSLVPYEQASITVVDAQAGRLRVLATGAREIDGPGQGAGANQEGDVSPDQRPAEEVFVPLLARGERVGTLHLVPHKSSAFAPDHVDIASEIATSLALAIQHARMQEELRQYAGSLEETATQRTRELQAERDRTAAILEAVGEAVIVTDTKGRILYTNPATVALTGYRPEEVVGKDWQSWQGEQGPGSSSACTQGILRDGRGWWGEMMQRRKDGGRYDAAVTVAPLFDPDDLSQLVGAVCVQRDITPLKEAERLKDEFVSNVSHELRTPLSVITLISGNLDRLYDQLDEDKRREMIRSIRGYVWVLNDLIDDVLQISHIDSGRVARERRRLDLGQLVHEEMEKQRPLAREKSQTVRVTGLESVVLLGNDGQLRRVVRNLLNNAIKFTSQGGRVTCECRTGVGDADWGAGWPGSENMRAGRWAALRVVDTGIGISRENLPHLFERFFRVETEGYISGTGLGLAIARELVELHEGHVGVTSTPGEGSVFAFYLPLDE